MGGDISYRECFNGEMIVLSWVKCMLIIGSFYKVLKDCFCLLVFVYIYMKIVVGIWLLSLVDDGK